MPYNMPGRELGFKNRLLLKTKKPPHFCDGFAPLAGLEPATL